MVRLAIVEDDDLYIRQLEKYLNRYQRESGNVFQVTVFHDGDEILDQYDGAFDIILMDIQMRFVDGMTAAEEIRKADQEVVIMFITNLEQYAVRGYQVDALDYIIKPVEYYAFSRKLDRAVGRIRHRYRYYLPLKENGGVRKVEVSQIRYVESQGHDLHFYTTNGEFISRITMQEIEKKLESCGFYRCGKGFLVNLAKVDSCREGICVIGDSRIPVSRAKRKDFMEALSNYMSDHLT